MAGFGDILRVIAVSSLIAIPMVGVTLATSPVHAGDGSVTLVSSGSVMADPLTSGDTASWTFAGDAQHEHAPYSFSEDGDGLHISVEAASAGQWAGFFAKSPNTYAGVFGALISLQYPTVPSGNFNTGLYVQTSNSVSYVACAVHATAAGYYWLVTYAQGSQSTAVKFRRLFTQVGGPLVRECTIATDGQNLLTVYLDGQKVYSNESMDLRMPPPFNAFLEVESTCASKMLTGTYSDFYEMTGDSVTIQGVPPATQPRYSARESTARWRAGLRDLMGRFLLT